MTIYTISEDCEPNSNDIVRCIDTPLYEWQIGTKNAAKDRLSEIHLENQEQGLALLGIWLSKQIAILRRVR